MWGPARMTPAVQRRSVAGARWAIPRRIHGARLAITSTARSERRIAVRRPGVGIDTSLASADPAGGPWRSTASSCQVPGTPRSSTLPRSSKPVPEPTTRSRTVRDTRMSPAPACPRIRAAMCTAIPPMSASSSSHSPVMPGLGDARRPPCRDALRVVVGKRVNGQARPAALAVQPPISHPRATPPAPPKALRLAGSTHAHQPQRWRRRVGGDRFLIARSPGQWRLKQRSRQTWLRAEVLTRCGQGGRHRLQGIRTHRRAGQHGPGEARRQRPTNAPGAMSGVCQAAAMAIWWAMLTAASAGLSEHAATSMAMLLLTVNAR